MTSCGWRAEHAGGADEQLRALLLEPAAAVHLALDLGEAGEHALDVLAARRGALAQDGVEQAARPRRAASSRWPSTAVPISMRAAGVQSASALTRLGLLRRGSAARPTPPPATIASASAPGSMSR